MWDYQGESGSIYFPGDPLIPEGAESGLPMYAPFQFVYGEPFSLSIRSGIFNYMNLHADYPGGAAGGEVDCMVFLIPDSPDATVVTESGHGY